MPPFGVLYLLLTEKDTWAEQARVAHPAQQLLRLNSPPCTVPAVHGQTFSLLPDFLMLPSAVQ